MKRNSVLFSIAAVICMLSMLLASCTQPTGSTTQSTQAPETTPQGTVTAPATGSTADPLPTPTPTPEEPYVFPEDGVLKLLADGQAPGAIDGHNPSLAGEGYTKLLVFFDCAFRKAGIDLAENTDITFKIKRQNGSYIEGTKSLDSSVAEIKNEYGYIGVCVELSTEFDNKEKITIESLSFKDKNGKEFKIENKTFYKGIAYRGINATIFDPYLGTFVKTTTGNSLVKQTGTVNGTDFTFTIGLNLWAEKTKIDQIVTISRLFWEVYPRMYARFGAVGESPTEIYLDIEDTGYGIAHASGNRVHIHDQWLKDNPKDFDCLTHEFAHVIQNGWSGDHCEYSGYIERFADACRYLYAYNNGEFNDSVWEMQTVSGENTRETSVRFLVWLDYFYSTEDTDLLLNFFTVCRSRRYVASKWDAAWAEIFKGSDAEGKNVEDLFNEFKNSEFARLSTKKVGSSSMLLRKYDVRARLD